MPVCRGVNAAELGKGEGLASRSTACPLALPRGRQSGRTSRRKGSPLANVRGRSAEQNSNGLQNIDGLPPPHRNDAPLFRERNQLLADALARPRPCPAAFGKGGSFASSPPAMAKPGLLNSLPDTDREQTWAPANPRRAPVIYFFKKEQQQSVISGIWKRCVPAQGSLPDLAGNDLIKIPAQPSACAPAELSADIRIFFLTQDARQHAALVCRLTAFVPSWMRRGEDLHFFGGRLRRSLSRLHLLPSHAETDAAPCSPPASANLVKININPGVAVICS